MPLGPEGAGAGGAEGDSRAASEIDLMDWIDGTDAEELTGPSSSAPCASSWPALWEVASPLLQPSTLTTFTIRREGSAARSKSMTSS
jgi:hypothetical protein